MFLITIELRGFDTAHEDYHVGWSKPILYGSRGLIVSREDQDVSSGSLSFGIPVCRIGFRIILMVLDENTHRTILTDSKLW